MTIEIHEPKVEVLLRKWMESGQFRSEEEAIGNALENAKLPKDRRPELSGRTGGELFAALQACPYADFMDQVKRIEF